MNKNLEKQFFYQENCGCCVAGISCAGTASAIRY
jgi:hypothetical protein